MTTNEEKLEQLKKQVADINSQIEYCEKELAKKKEQEQKRNEEKTLDELLKERDSAEDEKRAMEGNNILKQVKVEKSAITGKFKVIYKGSVLSVCDHPYKAGMVASSIELFDRIPAPILAMLASV